MLTFGHRNAQGIATRADGRVFLAEHGPDALTGDAVTASLLAAAAAESAAVLVGINSADTGEVTGGLDGWGDPRVEDAQDRAGEARRLAERAAF